MRILVADDSKTMLAITTATLQKMGHEVISTSSGPQAIEAFSNGKIDLIILDVVMSGMNGFECAKNIRAIDPDNWIPIIFLSASVDDESIAKGIDAGGDDYLTKPYSEITLAAKIKAMQRISDMRHKLFETTQKLYLQSSIDSLTGIYNRFQFDRSIKEIIGAADRFHHMIALLFIDLDNFKNINDSFGHKVGDLLLIEVAKRFKSCLRVNEFISRIGGDEFAIILNDIKQPETAGNIAQSLLDSLSSVYEIGGHEVRVGTSIGIACYPADGTTANNLIQNADIAMYYAKSLGRNNYQYYTSELDEKYKQQVNLEHALKFALDKKELYLTYQPIFDLQTKIICGIETLLCWEHPSFGHISPSTFLPIAEETGLMTSIGNWVIETACAQANKWDLAQFKNFKFSINLSSRQIQQEHFFQLLESIMKKNHIHEGLLELELTESTMMTYTSNTFKDNITKLHNMGISIAIDDFGTGYSSLLRLKHLPIRTLKIDKTFTQDAATNQNSAIIVCCLIALGRNLGLNVIAEGVETQEQLHFLEANGCPQGQGYFFNRPLTTDRMSEFIEKAKKNSKIIL